MKEVRNYQPENETQFRAFEEDNKKYIEGYASVFNQKSKLITERNQSFYEIIQPGAFTEFLSSNKDVIANLNHDRGLIMARIKSGNLTLSEDTYGLKYRFEVPNVSYANDTYELIKRGDLFESSFAFSIDPKNQMFSKDEFGNNIRTIVKIDRVYDVAVVTDGAYANTDVAARSIEENEKKENEEKLKKETDNIYKNKQKRNMDYITILRLKYN